MKRGRRGDGSVFQKFEGGPWIIQFYAGGKRIREHTGLTNRTAAQKKLRKRLTEVGEGEFVPELRTPVTIAELYTDLETDYKNEGRLIALRDAESRWRKHLKPYFGHFAAAALTTTAIKEYQVKRQAAGAERATINRELATLRRMLRLGEQADPPKVRRVPAFHLSKEKNTRTGFVTEEQFLELVKHAKDLWLRLFLELGFSYGWRKGELLKLRVRNVNFEDGMIRLDPHTTKNDRGREVAMTVRVRQLLEEACRSNQPDDYVLTRGNPHDLLHPKERRPVKDERKAWELCCVRAGLGTFCCARCEAPWVEGRRCSCGHRYRKYQGPMVHDLRRSAAKRNRAKGIPQSVVMKMGG